MGQAATALAHRINNLIGVVPASAGEIRRTLNGLELPQSDRQWIEANLDRIERNGQFILRLADALFRPFQEPRPRARFDVNRLLKEALQAASLPPNIHVIQDYDSGLPEVESNSLLVDIFLELITNARKAMVDGPEKRLEVRTRTWSRTQPAPGSSSRSAIPAGASHRSRCPTCGTCSKQRPMAWALACGGSGPLLSARAERFPATAHQILAPPSRSGCQPMMLEEPLIGLANKHRRKGMRGKILIVEDFVDWRELLSGLLQREGHSGRSGEHTGRGPNRISRRPPTWIWQSSTSASSRPTRPMRMACTCWPRSGSARRPPSDHDYRSRHNGNPAKGVPRIPCL